MSTELFNLGAQGLLSFPAKTSNLSSTDVFTISSIQDQKSYNVSWSFLQSQLLSLASAAPVSELSTGTLNQFFITQKGFHFYNGSKWRSLYSSPFNGDIDTLLPLDVNHRMVLTAAQKNNVLDALSVGVFTDTSTTPGLVSINKDRMVYTAGGWEPKTASEAQLGEVYIINDTTNTKQVPSYSWVANQFNTIFSRLYLPTASSTVLGGIKTSSSVMVDSVTEAAYVPDATSSTKGIVKILKESFTPEVNPDATVSASVLKGELDRVQSQITALPIATSTTLGVVRVGNYLNIDNLSGIVSVDESSETKKGVVQYGVISASSTTQVPSCREVANYVQSQLENAKYILPIASTARVGGIKSSDSITVDQVTGIAKVPTATDNIKGVVAIQSGQTEDPAVARAASAVWVTEQINAIDTQWNGGTVTNHSTFSGGLDTPDVVNVTSSSVLNYGQLSQLITPTNTPATFDKYGLVKLGTSTVIGSVSGNPVGVDENGRLTTSAGSYTLPSATPTTLGGIKASSSVVTSVDGTATVPLAAVNTPGIVQLATGSTISLGAGVGKDSQGRLSVPVVTSDSYGVVKPGTGSSFSNGSAEVLMHTTTGTLWVESANTTGGPGVVQSSYNETPINLNSGAGVQVGGPETGMAANGQMVVPGIHMMNVVYGTVQVTATNEYPTTRATTWADEYGRLYVRKDPGDFYVGDTLKLANPVKIMTYAEYNSLTPKNNNTLYIVTKNLDNTGSKGIYIGSTLFLSIT